MKKFNKKGFTIVELVIVIAVIAILSAVLIPTFSSLVKKANESSDIQAVKNMNQFLLIKEVEDGNKPADSILDVYQLFEDSNYVVENYQPLYKGRYFFYDKQQNKILYVDEEGKVLFPADLEGTTQGSNDWFSLSMEISKEKITPEGGKYVVSNASQYAYVVDQLNNNSWVNNEITIELSGTIDFKGAKVTISKVPTGKTLKLVGKDNAVIKNITSDTPVATLNANSNKVYTDYYCSALIGWLQGDLEITDIIFENINVKSINPSGVSLLVGGAGEGAQLNKDSIKFSNVTIKNSTVIGNRNVGALVGYIVTNEKGSIVANNVALENVKVLTVAGRSGLLYGMAAGSSKTGDDLPTNIDLTNCVHDIYLCELNSGSDDYILDSHYDTCDENCKSVKHIVSHTYSTDENGNEKKSTRKYGFNSNALYAIGDYKFVVSE